MSVEKSEIMTYQEQLKTAEWETKRLEILRRDDCTCYLCGYRGLKLNVHHFKYLPNRMAWDYPNDLLYTVCYDCHTTIHTQELIEKKVSSTKISNIIRNGRE